MTDQQRHDHVGWHPRAVVRTPNLDRLAAGGLVFENCYSASTTCVPARTSLLTGLLDHRTPHVQKYALEEGFFTVPRALRAAGYQTALLGKMHFTPIRADHGFEHMEVSEHFSAYPGDPADWGVLDHYHDWLAERGLADWRYEVEGGLACPYPYPAETHPTSWVRDRTLDFLTHQRDPSRPLFLVVSFPHPHPPVNPPEPYASMYDPADIAIDPDGAALNARLPAAFRRATEQAEHPHRRVDPSRIREHRTDLARTFGLITQIDDAVGAVTDALDLTNALLWFTADHGDFGGRRGLVRKIPWIPFDDLAKVPGFAAGGLVAGAATGTDDGSAGAGSATVGRRERTPVQSFDVATTCLDLAGLLDDLVDHAREHADGGAERGAAGRSDPDSGGVFDGVSQRDLLGDADASADPDRMVWSAISMNWPMVRRGPYKYVRELGWGQHVLFDVEGDPDETINLADHPYGVDLRDELSAAVDEQLRATTPLLPRL